MTRHSITSIILIGLLFLVSVMPALAHGGDEEGGAEAASSAGFALTGSTVLGIAVTLGLAATIGLVSTGSSLNLRRVQVGIIGLATTTAVVHILMGLNELILLLNGIGYLTLITATYLVPALRSTRGTLIWLLLGYTLLTITLYFVSHPWGYEHGALDLVGLTTKAVEVALVGFIFVDVWQSRQAPNQSPIPSIN